MKELIQAITQYQNIKGLNDVALARMLGVDNSIISRIKSGDKEPGGKVLRALSKIPELQIAVFNYLSTGEAVAANKE